jgi:hypothetical protein
MLYAPEPVAATPNEYASPPMSSERYILLPEDSGSPPLKLSQSDAQRIQEHTGYPPAEIEDNDLLQAMQELNIHSAPLTPEDYRAMGMQSPTQAGPGTVVVHRTHPTLPQPSIAEQLQSLHELQQNGLITEDDYNAKKKQLLGI